MKFKNKDEVADWALDQLNKYGIRHPDTYKFEKYWLPVRFEFNKN